MAGPPDELIQSVGLHANKVVKDVDELFRIKVPGFISRNPKDQIVSYYPNKATAFWVVYKFKLQSDAQDEAITVESDLSKFLSKTINNV